MHEEMGQGCKADHSPRGQKHPGNAQTFKRLHAEHVRSWFLEFLDFIFETRSGLPPVLYANVHYSVYLIVLLLLGPVYFHMSWRVLGKWVTAPKSYDFLCKPFLNGYMWLPQHSSHSKIYNRPRLTVINLYPGEMIGYTTVKTSS